MRFILSLDIMFCPNAIKKFVAWQQKLELSTVWSGVL